eukprot:6207148-Pleurochrysis_carterae.AAC.3
MPEHMVTLAGEDAEALMLCRCRRVLESRRTCRRRGHCAMLCRLEESSTRWWREALPVKVGVTSSCFDLTRLEIAAWGRRVGGNGSTVEDACVAYKAVASRLGRAWRKQK